MMFSSKMYVSDKSILLGNKALPESNKYSISFLARQVVNIRRL